MHKLTRITAAVLLSLSMASTGMLAAYADETANTQAETSHYPSTVFNSDAEANARAASLTAQFGKNQTYIAASARRQDGSWTPTFISGDALHNRGVAWYSMQMTIRNDLGNIYYRTYSTGGGWTPWAKNGEATQQGPVIEAVQIRIAGVIAGKYDIYYRSTLSDGTELDWASAGQTSGTMGVGRQITALHMILHPKNEPFTEPTENRTDSMTGPDGIQFHVNGLPTYTSGNGASFTGWAWDHNQRYYFINDEAATGWQYIDGYKYYFDETTGKLDSDLRGKHGVAGPYMLKVNRMTNTLTVYAQDGNKGYILPVVSFLTTTGDSTPNGTFQIPEKYTWRLMIGNVYSQYAMRVKDGYMLHSILFARPDHYTLNPNTYNNLGIGRSHGCIRLKTGDIKWLFDNCPVGTTVVIYQSPVNGPFEAPVLEEVIPTSQHYDPTDPAVPEAVADMQTKAARIKAEEAAIDARNQKDAAKKDAEAAKKRAEEAAKTQQEAEENGLGGGGSIAVTTDTPTEQETDTPAGQDADTPAEQEALPDIPAV